MFKVTLKSSLLAACLACTAVMAQADPVVFDRGLPTANLNNGAGANRSNVAWGFGDNSPRAAYYSGDDFTLAAGQWKISTLRTWAVIGGVANLSPTLIADRYSSISLYGGSGTTLTNLMSGATAGNSTNNPNITITQVHYAGNLDYDSFGTPLNIFEIDFNNLNWIVNGGVSQNFSVAGVDNPSETAFRPFFMHASNAGLGGAAAAGADNLYSAYFDNGVGGLNFDSQINSLGNGWDKSSDINVQIEASVVPEPAPMALFGVALAGLAASRRKRAAKQ